MNAIALKPEVKLPVMVEELSRFVLIGREKLAAVRAEIRAIEKVGLAKAVHEQKKAEGQALAEAVLDAEVRIGQLMREVPKAKENQYTKMKVQFDSSVEKQKSTIDSGVNFEKQDDTPKEETPLIIPEYKPQTKAEVIKEAGFTQKQAERFQTLAAHPEIVEQAKKEARENDDIVSRSLVLNMIRSQKKAEELEQAREKISSQERKDYEAVLKIGDGIGYKPERPYDLLLTDPPYSTDIDDVENFAGSWLPNALEHVKSTGSAYIFIGAYPEELRAYLNVKIPEHMTLKQVLIWTYKNTLGNNPKDRYKQNYQVCLFYRGIDAPDLDCPLTNEQWAVHEINAPDGRVGNRFHSWQKPLEIAERFIRHSTKARDVVFDPFACTGTFLIAASKLGRKGYGFEINPENAKIAEKRGVILLE